MSLQGEQLTFFSRPALRTPPALTPEGEVVQPPIPKSFLQKYWLYIVGFLLVFCKPNPYNFLKIILQLSVVQCWLPQKSPKLQRTVVAVDNNNCVTMCIY